MLTACQGARYPAISSADDLALGGALDGIAEDRLRRSVRSGHPPDDDLEVAQAGLQYARRNRLAVFGTATLWIPLFVAVLLTTRQEERAWLRWLVWVLVASITALHGVIAPVLAQRNVRRAVKAVERASRR